MELMKWDESFSVNVKEIDEQHQKLVAMINALHAAMKEGKGNDVLGGILGRMAEYTVFHFETEEKYFDEFHYEKTDEHKAQHKAFVDKVIGFKKELSEGSLSLSIDVMNFLVDWLKNHIKGADKAYSKCFNEHGLS